MFSPATTAWFAGAFPAPTPVQNAAWPVITRGDNALVVAPTGSGKTLAAFLWAVDRLTTEGSTGRPRVLYVSPLKALAVDVQRNLRTPLAGIRATGERLGHPVREVSLGVRSGDTPPNERRRLLRHPPDILITTPESLYLMLTSKARETLTDVDTVIVDEVHAVAGTKRGAHLALSLERLDDRLPRPAQRIGLSATVRPVDEVARFLGGERPVTVVQPDDVRTVDLQVVVPVADLAAMGTATGEIDGSAAGESPRASIWPHVEERIVDLVQQHRSTLVFANSRRLAERLCARLNEVHQERLLGESLPPEGSLAPASVMASGATRGAAPHLEIARAHHGSVSREQRAQIEDDLKSGRLPAVVATSTLELGIDMGAIDLVVQVESPPSVASGLQRIGRAEHHVDGVSRGVLFPKHRGDLVPTAVTVERMRTGEIESIRTISNPLDVLAQHVVSMAAMDDWDVDRLGAVVRRAAPFAALPQSALDGVLDMLAGRYPSDAFAELRPRIVWDREAGVLTARPGAARLAVVNGGTIPDRGQYGVFLAGGEPGSTGRRVGELDEEMVYESRVGDVIALGATSWRIEQITHDRVLVTPAPGLPGRLPFWHGDTLGRPAELGRAIGAFVRELGAADETAARARTAAAGLDRWASDNLLAYLAEQRQATGLLPDDRTVVVERFRDEVGDWRIAILSPFGGRVHAPWALALTGVMREEFGVDVQAMPSDDGIVLRLPEVDLPDGPSAATGEHVVIDPDDVEQIVTDAVGGSALFAARFRECAARALMLPRRRPDRRTPLWQQRQRSAQLLSVVSEFGTFPVALETMRECLQDVFDVPELVDLMRRIRSGEVRIVEVETTHPSPFARSLLLDYVGAFLYEGDAPLAERRAQALSLDSTLLAELLGQAELRELLDLAAMDEVEQELQRLAKDRQVRDVEGLADLLRVLGPLTEVQAAARGAAPEWGKVLVATRRAVQVRIAGEEHLAGVEDVARLRDALGVPPPAGVPAPFLDPVADPLGDLVARQARTHAPFRAAEVAARLGLGVAVVEGVLQRLAARGQVVAGEFRPGGSGTEWCDTTVLRLVRRRSVAALRHEIEPVPADALARFLPAWHGVGGRLRGTDGVLAAVEQLRAVPLPLGSLETSVLPARVADYRPAMLDELTAAGEVVWIGHAEAPGGDGWVSLHPVADVPLLRPEADPEPATPLERQLLEALAAGGAQFFRGLSDRVGSLDDRELEATLWGLVWQGLVTNDTLAPLRRRGPGRRAPVAGVAGRRARYGRPGRAALPSRAGPPSTVGRWSRLPAAADDPTRRAHARAAALLDRHGVVTRGAVVAERPPGGFSATYRVLAAFEETGRARRGYFVEGLGAAQFALPGAVDRLRALVGAAEARSTSTMLAAADPANPYGAALPWPERSVPGGHQPGRKLGAHVVTSDGVLTLYLERGGHSLLTFTEQTALLEPAVHALAGHARRAPRGLTLRQVDGVPVLEQAGSQLLDLLGAAGFTATPRGLRLRP